MVNMRKLTEHEGTDDTSVKYKLRHFSKFRILLVVTAILALLAIIFIILFAVEKSKVHDLTSQAPKTPKVQTYCGTKICLDTALGKHT